MTALWYALIRRAHLDLAQQWLEDLADSFAAVER